MAKPDPMRFMSATDYLAAVYSHRKSLDSEFSYQRWAEELGFKNRSFLRLMVTGQRSITAESREMLIRGLRMTPLEGDYFSALVAYGQAPDPAAKENARLRAFAILRNHHDQIEIPDAADFLMNPSLPVLQTLLSFTDVVRTPEALAPLLGTEPETLSLWLTTLERLGLARKVDGGSWSATHSTFKVPEALGSGPRQHYHSSILKKGLEAIRLPPSTRLFRSLLIALNAQEYAELLKEVDAAATKALAKYGGLRLEGREIYHFNTSLFPSLAAEVRVQMIPEGCLTPQKEVPVDLVDGPTPT